MVAWPLVAIVLGAMLGCVSVGYRELDGCVRACARHSDPVAVEVFPVIGAMRCACQDGTTQPLPRGTPQ